MCDFPRLDGSARYIAASITAFFLLFSVALAGYGPELVKKCVSYYSLCLCTFNWNTFRLTILCSGSKAELIEMGTSLSIPLSVILMLTVIVEIPLSGRYRSSECPVRPAA